MKTKIIFIIGLIVVLFLMTGCQPKLKTFSDNSRSCEANGGTCMLEDTCMRLSSWTTMRGMTCQEPDMVCCVSLLE
ncbi:hypothetical protein HN789_03245 [archaeon]|jgi:hypothetical protein|nr:hypothetical protein [archaeon]MBT4022616.1 hypothetical protein [archaeon]MBT4272056.1 hypothetical protein [archaeon]MBT4461153.1 hypothetical protein [archaeon]MBT4858854.1 hypothetical protein [archaeon]